MHAMNTRRFLRHLLIGIGLVSTAAASAPPDAYQSPESIRDLVKQHLIDRVESRDAESEVTVDDLDPRLRLSRCDRPLEAFLPPSAPEAGRVTVGVRCRGSAPWSLYVPSRVRLLQEVVVARRELERGEMIQAGDLTLETRDLARLHRGYVLDPDKAVGLTPQRTIRRGRVVTPSLLRVPNAIDRGAQVNIVAWIGGIEARMKGEALGDGARGERIRVKNLSSGKELEGRIVSSGVVRVDL